MDAALEFAPHEPWGAQLNVKEAASKGTRVAEGPKATPFQLSTAPPSERVFVGKIPWTVTAEDLGRHFEQYGRCEVKWPARQNGELCYAYVTFDNVHTASEVGPVELLAFLSLSAA